MTWRLETSCGFESEKIAPNWVQYLQGKRTLDIGCGQRKVWPSVIGIDNGHHFGKGGADIVGDGRDLSLFADGTIDNVFSSHTLEHFTREDMIAALNEWARVLKVGGNIVLYVPSANFYPKIGEFGANPDHRQDLYPGDIETLFSSGTIVGSWTMLECEERSASNEYSLFYVFRKDSNEQSHGFVDKRWHRNPNGKKRALVIRYGAIGDILQTSSVFSQLRKQGYHVTVNCKQSSHEIIKHDPFVDEWFLQDTDFVPNAALGVYWQMLAERYDLIVNHCESIEGSLLTLPGRLTHQYPDATRRKLFGKVNYVERLHDIAGTKFAPDVKFYPTAEERKWSIQQRQSMSHGVVVWALNGTSYHKIYPFVQVVVAWLMQRTPLHVVLMGDEKMGVPLQDACMEAITASGCDLSRLHPMAGKWTIREALTFAQLADCVVGPETGILNAVATEPMPKVLMLSHSSKENLSRDWINCTTLTPDLVRTPCYPCHRLHHNWEFCHEVPETHAALCASNIRPEDVYKAIVIKMQARIGKAA